MATLNPFAPLQQDLSVEKHLALHAAVPVVALIPARIQWASSVAVPTAAGDVTVVFPLPFSSIPFCIIVSNGERGQGSFYCGVFAGTTTTTQFTVRLENSGGPFLPIARFNWIAIA